MDTDYTDESDNSSNSRNKSRVIKALEASKLKYLSTKFMSDFNPRQSNRERNKILSKVSKKMPSKKYNDRTSLYDERGRIRHSNEDICDCFEVSCPGCHFPCERCESTKCGPKCRINRKWAYETIEHDGKQLIKKNPLVTLIAYR